MRLARACRSGLLLCSFASCLLVATRCGETPQPDPIVSGTYSAWVPPGHFDDLYLQLENNGGTLTGTACFTLDGYVVFRGVPVSGTGSTINFTVRSTDAQGCTKDPGGTSLAALMGSDGTLKGTFRLMLAGDPPRTEAVTLNPYPDGDICAKLAPIPCAQ